MKIQHEILLVLFVKTLKKSAQVTLVFFAMAQLSGCESLMPILEGVQQAIDEQCRNDPNCQSF